MTESDFLKRQKAAATREFRIQSGCDPDAAKWQEALEMMLVREGDRLVSGRLESYEGLGGDEAKVLRALAKKVIVPDGVCIIYIPPSVIEAMMADGRLPSPAGVTSESVPDAGTDIGILIGARCECFDTILYAQFGLPPHMPGTEVYRDGEALAIYQYTSIDHCISELNGIIETYLGPAAIS